MTTGALLDQSSSVTNVSAWVHLQSLVGGGFDHYFPYTDITVEFQEQDLKVAFTEQDLKADFIEQDLRVVLEDTTFNVTFEEQDNDINITC